MERIKGSNQSREKKNAFECNREEEENLRRIGIEDCKTVCTLLSNINTNKSEPLKD